MDFNSIVRSQKSEVRSQKSGILHLLNPSFFKTEYRNTQGMSLTGMLFLFCDFASYPQTSIHENQRRK